MLCLQIQPKKFPRDLQDTFNALLMSVNLRLNVNMILSNITFL